MKIFILLIALILMQSGQATLYDPTMPPWLKIKKSEPETKQKAVKQVKERFNLTQIVKKESGNRAVVNGYVLKEGEHIHRAQVVKIESNQVILVRGTEKWILKLEEKSSNVRR